MSWWQRFQKRFVVNCVRIVHMGINNKKDVLLLLLYSPGKSDAPNEPISGRTRVIKLMYLFKKEVLKHFKKGTEITDDNFYSFFAWNFGPFSTEIYDDLTFFMLQGFVEEKDCYDEPALPESEEEWEIWQETSGVSQEANRFDEYYEREYKLSNKGVNFVEMKLWPNLKNNQKRILREFKANLVDVPLRALVRYVYSNYPEDTAKSIIKDDILGRND